MWQRWEGITAVLDRIRGRPVERNLRAHQRRLGEIQALESEVQAMPDPVLQQESARLATGAREGQALDALLARGFAVAREASRRVLGLRPFDEQVLAALALHEGKLAEQQTGEGKTLAAVLPAYLNALTGRGVHILTFNDYLARRDAAWMGPIYEFLGLSVGHVQDGMAFGERRKAYDADVTYLTAKEAGFDFLRDQLVRQSDLVVQRPFHYAIVDEADSMLIDEARVPLVIAGSTAASVLDARDADQTVAGLDAGADFETGLYAREVRFTDQGLDRLEASLACGNLHDDGNLLLLTALNLALRARVLLHRDVHYIVRDGRVELVDEFTGRVIENRRWPDGLQEAVEAKEHLATQPAGEVLGSITLQHLMERYPKRAGMTATAVPAAEELRAFYGLTVVEIPPHRPCIRRDHADRVFSHKQAKHRALCQEICQAHATGRPILVGTATVRESEELAASLLGAGVAPQVLNAKNDEEEAEIIARTGDLGAVTIATNMAGRGTDIRLGGVGEERRGEVVALGGLYVIGTNRHESRRIDDQLRGRAGRQGDPGETRFFISLEDDLIERYGIHEIIPARRRPAAQSGPIEDPVIHRSIARAQRIIEGQTFELRKTLRKYTAFVEGQRRLVQARRETLLAGTVSVSGLATVCRDRYRALLEAVGEPVLHDVERQITLAHIDRGWTDHLARVAHIREGIHLFGMTQGGPNVFGLGGPSALDEVHSQAIQSFGRMNQEIDQAIVHTFETASITKDGVDLDELGLRGPSSTWTYLLDENPLGGWMDRLFQTVVQKLRKERS